MKIVYVSYAHVKVTNNKEWLSQLSFYTGILEKQCKNHQVVSFHCTSTEEKITQSNVEYQFIKYSWFGTLVPFVSSQRVARQIPDAIIIHGLHSGWQLIWLRFYLNRKTKVFAWHHAEKPKRFPKSTIQRIADNFTHGYFFVSNKMAQSWVDTRQIKSLSKVNEVMEASSSFFPSSKEDAKGKTGMRDGKNYLWVGRLDENKDPLTLVKAFLKFSKEHERANLYVIYKGDHLLPEIKNLVGSNHSSIVFVGEIIHDELQYWYNSADYIISTSHYEGSGIAVCEGMSCGCIPILSRIPSFEKMTRNGKCGLLFEAGNETSLCDALVKSLSLELNQERKLTLQQFENNLSFEAIAKNINEVIFRQ